MPGPVITWTYPYQLVNLFPLRIEQVRIEMNSSKIIQALQLQPHPEGGFYRETWVAPTAGSQRPTGTCIYFLLTKNQRSHWHRVDATEIWHYYAGAPLVLSLSKTENGPVLEHLLTHDLTKGYPQVVVPAHHWQSARTTGEYTLVGCTVSPGFHFDGFELAPPDFTISQGGDPLNR